MRYRGSFFPKRVVSRVNGCVTALRDSPRWGQVVNKRITIITYTGQRSGRVFSTPVAYRHAADIVTIGVQLPEAKTWWRNFMGEGGLMSLQLNGTDRTGHAIAHRDEKGRVTITVHLSD